MSTHLILYLVSTVGKVLLNETWLISKFPATSTISLSSSPLTLYFKVVWLLQCLDSKHFITNTIMAGRAFPGGASGKERACQCRRHKRHGFDPFWEDPLEEGMAIHSNILTWRIPWTEESGGLQSIGSQRVGHDWSDLVCMHVSILFQILSHIDYCSIMSRVPCAIV